MELDYSSPADGADQWSVVLLLAQIAVEGAWTHGAIFRGWARNASGDTANGILWIEDAIEDFRSTGSTLAVPFWLSLNAEALYLADRTSDAL